MAFKQRFRIFLTAHKRWWLTPIIIVAVLFVLLLMSSKGGEIPWIYSLF